jgi:hypothetical protein
VPPAALRLRPLVVPAARRSTGTLGVMSPTPKEIEDWASAYIEAEQLRDVAKHDGPLWWSIDRFMNLSEPQQAEDAWAAILEILARRPPDQVIGILAAGPLEDLIEEWGTVFIDRIEREARENQNFRYLLGGVWRSSTAEVWERVERARGTSW